MLFAEAAFQYYIDNQITDSELIEILAKENFLLPDSFISLSIREKKNIFKSSSNKAQYELEKNKMQTAQEVLISELNTKISY